MTTNIRETTGRIITDLYGYGHSNKAVLASLRHATSITSQQAQPVWPVLIANLEEHQLSISGVPTQAEVAVYSAVRLYAIHQQGVNDHCVYASAGDEAKGMQLFSALANQRSHEDTRVALDRRVRMLLATTNVNSIINSLSHMVSILKASDAKLKIDYSLLALDLYGLQLNHEHANKVRLRWGEQYYWVKKVDTKTEGEQI